MDTSGSNKRMDSLTYTSTAKTYKLGLSPKNNKAGIENTWQVYLRQRLCQKTSQLRHSFSTIEAEIDRSRIQAQYPQNLAQIGTACTAINAPITETTTHNGGLEANTEPQHIHEAANIWSMAKQMGATRGDEQNIIIEKIKSVEERDKTEFERWGDSRRNQ